MHWLASVSGDYRISITVNGLHICGSPFKAHAERGYIDATPGSLAEKLPPNLQEALYFQAAACSIYAQYVES